MEAFLMYRQQEETEAKITIKTIEGKNANKKRSNSSTKSSNSSTKKGSKSRNEKSSDGNDSVWDDNKPCG
ncbi:hypothetical protein AGMMS49990_10150 [Endomicrobiia bacterium]|nr:hypothetical protein AGMMS49990_10150 [Endomicrobiia bacterium]